MPFVFPRGRNTAVRLAALATLATQLIWSQSYQGSLRGHITDESGAAVATAKVTATDMATGVARSTVTNDAGEYVFQALNPSDYKVTVEAQGFKAFESKAAVATQSFVTVDVKMPAGNVVEPVQVTEELPLIESANASTGQVVDRQKLVDLPNLGRNPFYNRMQDQSGSLQISIAGGPLRGNNYLLDGVPITDSTNRAVIIPTIESVREVTIQAHGRRRVQHIYEERQQRAARQRLRLSARDGVAGQQKAQFRAEALNAFNIPLFRSPNTASGNANFGKVTSQASFSRLIQLGVRVFL